MGLMTPQCLREDLTMSMQSVPRLLSTTASSVAGVLLMLLGLGWLSTNLGYLDAREWISQGWPLVLIVLGLGRLPLRRHDQVVLGLALILAGAWAFAIGQRWLQVGFWAVFGPTCVILIGGAVIWLAIQRAFLPQPAGRDAIAGPATAYLRIFHILSGSELHPSTPFAGAELTAVMGGALIDLSRAPMLGEYATIDAFLFMGGAEIIVPPDWEVTVSMFTFMGGVSDKRRPVQAPTRRLFITGSALLGGIEIKS
jgi:hypothetical protein